MALNFLLPLRAIQGVFAIIELGLTSYIVHKYHEADFLTNTKSPSENNFLLFVSIWTFIALTYLTLAPMIGARVSHRVAFLAFEVITMIFWFAGFIALAVFVGRITLCVGHVCSALRAAVVFAAFEWVLWLATTILTALDFNHSRSGLANTGGKNHLGQDPAFNNRV